MTTYTRSQAVSYLNANVPQFESGQFNASAAVAEIFGFYGNPQTVTDVQLLTGTGYWLSLYGSAVPAPGVPAIPAAHTPLNSSDQIEVRQGSQKGLAPFSAFGGGGGGGAATSLNIPLVDPIPGTLTSLVMTVAALSKADFPAATSHVYEWAFSLQEGVFWSDGSAWRSASLTPPTQFICFGTMALNSSTTYTGTTETVIPGSRVQFANQPGFAPIMATYGDQAAVRLSYTFGTFTSVVGGTIQTEYSLDNGSTWTVMHGLVVQPTTTYGPGGVDVHNVNGYSPPGGSTSALYTHNGNVLFRATYTPNTGASAEPLVLENLTLSYY